MEIFLGLLFLVSGFALGIMNKGLTININHKNEEAPEEYNESMVEHLDPEVRVYMEQNNGNYKF